MARFGRVIADPVLIWRCRVGDDIMVAMSESSLQPGARVGNYILQELIGAGGFAQVWKAAHHERPGRVVAVKIAVEEDFRRALSREGRLPDIDHPNVVPILDSDTRFADPPYIVLPYLPGGNLADLIAKHPHGLPEERVESLLRDILAGLAAAHGRGIVHRDVKPSNVLLDGGGKAMISDFGISLTAAAPGVVRTIVQSGSLNTNGMIAGTLAYMAPEVLEGNAATKSSDVYSVGVMLFEMLVGRRPGGLESPSRRRQDLRAARMWHDLYRSACAASDQRYADAKVMGDGLRSLKRRAAPPPAVRVHPEQVPPKPTAAPASIVVPHGTVERPPWQALSPMTAAQAKGYYGLGVLCAELGQYEEAIQNYDAALRLDPKDAMAYDRRGLAKGELGQYEEAIRDFDKAIRLDPKDARAYNNRGIAKADLGRHADAIEDFDEALRLDPQYVAAYTNRGLAKFNLGRHAHAIKDYDAAIRLDPKDAMAYYARGAAKFNLGRHADAIEDFEEAIRLDPKDATAYYGRAMAKFEKGDIEGACADRRKALEIEPSLPVGGFVNRLEDHVRSGGCR
jgi:serine/threonine protein kinase